ncbi:DUF1456 family protein [Fusobacterium sp.]|uniref:DUF1456 family protein n=1 Tax=Fusobacterium sp. TaxID=68766 RepID=UPI000C70651E|nr:DUF1456 family protein [Fusobacterium sp.]
MLRNNDIIRRVRYALDIKDNVMVNIFKDGGCDVTREEVINILKREEDEGFLKCNNKMLEAFLDGLIIFKRGRQEPKPGQVVEPVKINKNNINNIILKKLKIALSFKSDDIINILGLAGVKISPSELSALFRKEDHKNYRECGDRYVRNFLKGLALYYRG